MPNTLQFDFEGHRATLIVPDTPAASKPYVWRTEFLGAFDHADRALLARGYHIAYCAVQNEYGSPYAMGEFKRFHDHLTAAYGLSPRAALFGFSRGGLYAVNYALAHPGDVACLYLDAPVLDLKSWPAGLGMGDGAAAEWADCKARVMRAETVEEILAWPHNPIDHVGELIATHLPVLLVAGGADTVVPYAENGARLVAAYHAAGAGISVIMKPDCGHHPHSLEDPAPIVEFVEGACHA